MNPTKIEWCDMTFNPVTGCLHNCEYCYARKIANRFKTESGEFFVKSGIDEWQKWRKGDGIYTRYFNPQFHKDRLDEPQHHKKPRNIFVCSMADLFGDWVPDEIIKKVFEACENAPQHRYLFLTKNQSRYDNLHYKKILPWKALKFGINCWFGVTITNGQQLKPFFDDYNFFLSYEPIMGEIDRLPQNIKWVIAGAETGNRKNKSVPHFYLIEKLVKQCEYQKIPLFMKDSLAGIWGKELIQQYPWEV
ncbi:MAG: phage Gp37/Gp68 family protein [Fibromonadaceae bacterium]|jgi:protein gp37|nr:phage Gp37/Gp68 family protein [Fibromonadaceae bacterium]